MYKTYYYDTETNLYYLNARYYDPSIGRFLSRDPKLGLDDNRLGKNEYIYVENSPIQNSDPNGLRTRFNYKNYSYNYAKRRASYWHRKYKRAYKTRNKSKASWRSFVKARGTAWFWYDQVYGAKRAMKRGRSKHAGRNKSRTRAQKKRARKRGHKDVKRVDKKYKHKRGWAPKSVKRRRKKRKSSLVDQINKISFKALKRVAGRLNLSDSQRQEVRIPGYFFDYVNSVSVSQSASSSKDVEVSINISRKGQSISTRGASIRKNGDASYSSQRIGGLGLSKTSEGVNIQLNSTDYSKQYTDKYGILHKTTINNTQGLSFRNDNPLHVSGAVGVVAVGLVLIGTGVLVLAF